MAATRNPLEEFAWGTEQFLKGMDQTLSALERDPSDEKAIVNFTMDIEGVQKSAEGLSLERINVLSWHMLQAIEALPQIAVRGGHKPLIVSLDEAVSRVLSLAKTSADIGYEPEGDDSRILKALKSMTADSDNNLSNLPDSGTIQEPSAKRKSSTPKVSAEKAAPMSASAKQVKQKTETTKARAAEAETRPENKKYSAITREIFNRFADERRDLDVVFLDYQTDWGPNFKRASSITLNLIVVRALLRALPFFQQKYFKYDVSLRHYNHDRDHKAQAFHLINIRYLHYMWLNCLSGGKLKLTRVEPSTNNRILDEFTNYLVKLLTLRNVDSGSKIRQLLALMHQKGRADIHYKAFVSDVNGLDRERPTWTPLWHGSDYENIETKGNGLGIWKTWSDWYERISTKPDFDIKAEAKVAEYLATLPEGIPYGNSIADINDKIAKIRADNKKPAPSPDDQTYSYKRPDYVSDAAETVHDTLNRGPLAYNLAMRFNKIWRDRNPSGPSNGKQPHSDEDAFITLVDAPWGGGKTTFANYLTRILNPGRYGLDPYSLPPDDGKLSKKELGERDTHGFLANLPLNDTSDWPEDYRKPWAIAWHNLWQGEHVEPPWWNFYIRLRKQCFDAVRKDPMPGNISKWGKPWAWAGRHLRWLNLWRHEIWWRVMTPELKTGLVRSVVLASVVGAVSAFLYFVGIVPEGTLAKTYFSETAGGLATLLGVGTAASASVKGWQKLAKSMLAENIKPNTRPELGSEDPLEDFRKHFQKMMRLIDRPILVVIDDIDRCKAKTVTELVTGLMTIFKSDRIVYLMLGDRRWIEKACEKLHATMRYENQSHEQFARRYVEKTIQLSAILPASEGATKSKYISGIMGLPLDADDNFAPQTENNVSEADAQQGDMEPSQPDTSEDPSKTGPELSRDAIRKARQSTQTMAPEEAVTTVGIEEHLTTIGVSADKIKAAKTIIEEETTYAQATSLSEEVRLHRLHQLVDLLPPNPRRVKRIINMISLYEASTTTLDKTRDRYTGDDDQWKRLARFVILASEHPKEWGLMLADKALAREVLDNPAFGADTLEEKFGTNLGDDEKTDYENHMLFLNPAIQALLYDEIPDDGREENGPTHKSFINHNALDDFRLLMPIEHR